MLLKGIGSLIVCMASALIGLYFAGKSIYRARDLNEIKKALLLLQAEIEFAHNPLPVAFGHMAERVGEPVKLFCRNMSTELSKRSGTELIEVWQQELKLLQNTYLQTEDLAMLHQLGQTLGYLNKDVQKNSIGMAVSYIDEKTLQIQSESDKNKRLYRSLGILGGMLITIVLL